MNPISKFSYLRSLLPSIYFNFKYLPIKQAIKLPILVYKPTFHEMGGSVKIESSKIHFGMIRIGFWRTATYPNTGISWRNRGKIIFKGTCIIGNDSSVLVGRQGTLTFGNDFIASAGLKLVSECRVTFGEHTRLGWGEIIIDTNFHLLYDMEKETFKKGYGPITIGDYNWFGLQCFIMPGVSTPEHCTFGARTTLTRGFSYEPNCVYGGSPMRMLSRNVIRDYGNDVIKDYSV